MKRAPGAVVIARLEAALGVVDRRLELAAQGGEPYYFVAREGLPVELIPVLDELALGVRWSEERVAAVRKAWEETL